jgi:hypothetical protein
LGCVKDYFDGGHLELVIEDESGKITSKVVPGNEFNAGVKGVLDRLLSSRVRAAAPGGGGQLTPSRTGSTDSV